jgi:hypothetical protein
MNFLNNFNAIIKALNQFEVDYILIGGYAVILHGLPRTTQDMDLIIKMSGENIKNLQTALRSVYNDSEINEIKFEELKKYAVIRYGTPDNFNIDIMAGIGENANYDNIEFEIKEVDDLKIKLATAGALFKLKKNSMRPQDQSDAVFLSEILKK